MVTFTPTLSTLARLALAAAALAIVSACTEPAATDYREKYPVSAYPTSVVLGVHVAGARVAFAGDEEQHFNAVVAGYLDHGHAPITVSAPRPARSTASVPPGAEAVRARLIAAGVPARDIQVALTEQGSPETVTVSYERYEAVLPTCGDWTASLSHDPYNDVAPNFGCALQRDIGLMAADPADLVRARPAAPTDAQNAGRVIQRYRVGAPTWATPNPPQTYGNSENQSGGQ
ncbi:MAG TPA: CpaD family pilus assembly lipoprotein [Methylomirabilota bacterium]|nr:CpaD family pilus assembly lipoprotein [Methylomirabilota bacterium]